MADPRLPVTLLTGFLGAGKTTLLNAVLADASTGRIAVIVNEFGEAGLNHDLIETPGEDITLMKSGCLCCSLRGELAEALLDLLARRDTGDLGFDRIVIETTGLAEPGPIVQTLVADRALTGVVRLDGIVTAVDAVNGVHTLETQFEAVEQVALADLLLLTKPDLAGPAQRTAITARLRDINPAAEIRETVRGAGMSGALWGLSAVGEGVSVEAAVAWTTLPQTQADPLANLSGLAPRAPDPAPIHDNRIVTASVVIPDPIDGDVFDQWLGDLIALRGEKLLRLKGIVFLADVALPFVFHGVQHIFHRPLPLREWKGGDRVTRVVVIARDVSKSRVQRNLDALAHANAERAGLAQMKGSPPP